MTPKVNGAITQILVLCKQLGISISHEDYQGGFIIEPWSEANASWLRGASDATDPKPAKSYCSKCAKEIIQGWKHRRFLFCKACLKSLQLQGRFLTAERWRKPK